MLTCITEPKYIFNIIGEKHGKPRLNYWETVISSCAKAGKRLVSKLIIPYAELASQKVRTVHLDLLINITLPLLRYAGDGCRSRIECYVVQH